MWSIKDIDGNIRVSAEAIEYNGKWLGERYVTVSVESPYPIDFQIGDWIEYRGERFEINYEPGKIKSAPRLSRGDAFRYENIKFNSLADELVRCDFLDVVPNDNEIHFTGLPKFSFYAASVKDLADRIQANLDRCYPGQWSVEVHPEYADKTDVNVCVDKNKVWDALKICVDDFGAYFTIRGRHITIGTAGVPASHIFTYGKGNGLYEIEQNAEADQLICTRLRAYGSERNLPNRYYHNIPDIDRANAPIHAVLSKEYVNGGGAACVLTFRFLDPYVDLSKCVKDGERYWFAVTIAGVGYAAFWDPSLNAYVVGRKPSVSVKGVDNTILRASEMEKIGTGTIVTFEAYASGAPGIVKSVGVPNNMAVNFLMLPGFPLLTQDPYIDSPNIDTLGIRENSVFFDGSDPDLEEIYPSIEGMTADDVRKAGYECNSEGALDELTGADTVDDDGLGKITGDKSELDESDAYFKVYIKDVGFDINDCLIEGNSDNPTVSFKSGKLGGRDFEIFSCKPVMSGAKVSGYELELKRVYDDSLKLWFPYRDYNAGAGDRFVLLYIGMPDVYIASASQRLAKAANEWLAKHEYSRSIYSPKIDELFMARQHDEAMQSNGRIASLHDSLQEGMQLLFEDDDLNINAAIFIEQLTIKEGDGPVPTYSVTLKEEPTVGALQKMQNQIDSLSRGGQGGGYNAEQIRALINAYGSTLFLNKFRSDRTPYDLSVGGKLTAEDVIGSKEFAEGLTGFGWKGDKDGHFEMDSLTLRRFLEVPELRYNRTEVYTGIEWHAPGGGIVENASFFMVDRFTQDITCTLYLKLEDGEIGAVSEGDICMGIWHFEGENQNETEDEDSGTGNFKFAGFCTIYFEILSVKSSNNGNCNDVINVKLRSGYSVPGGTIPEGLHFVCYGNRTNKDRQTSRYATRTYERYLAGVNDYTFGPDNIKAQFGDLSNLEVNGVPMKGYSAYLNDVYFSGVIRQLEDARPILTLDVWGDPFVGGGRNCIVVPRIVRGVQDVTRDYKWIVQGEYGWMANYGASESPAFTIGADALNGHDSAVLTVTAYPASESGYISSVCDARVVIRAYDSLKGQDGTFAFNLLKDSQINSFFGTETGNQYVDRILGMKEDGFCSTIITVKDTSLSRLTNFPAAINNFLTNGLSTLIKGNRYTLSFDYRTKGKVPQIGMHMQYTSLSDSSVYNVMDVKMFDASENWQRASITFDYKPEIVDIRYLYLEFRINPSLCDVGDTVEIRKFCISEGDSDAWAPTYEEIQGKDGKDGTNGKDGQPGKDGQGAFKSTAFIRSNVTPATAPTGGSYASPLPTSTHNGKSWSDGIPAGEEILWATTRIFTSDGKSPQESNWSTPRQMTDTADFDVEFSSELSPKVPSGHPNTNSQWGNSSSESTIWMATSRKSNGVWSDWEISRIKGEKGEDGKDGRDAVFSFNLLDDTKTQPDKWGADSDCSAISRIGDDGFLTTVIKNLATTRKGAYALLSPLFVNGEQTLKAGRTYTLGFDYKYTGKENSWDFSLLPQSAYTGTVSEYLIYRQVIAKSDVWKRITFTFNLEKDITELRPAINSHEDNINSEFSVRKFCLTEGYTEEWVPSYKDIKGQGVFKSIVFRRSAANPGQPSGGSYSSPVPGGWSDGIPAEQNGWPCWMSSRTFTSDGNSPQDDAWSVPQIVSSTSEVDIKFSHIASNPGNPTSNPNNWHDAGTADVADIWMAVRKASNGTWGAWQVSKIKGEQGEPGEPGENGKDAEMFTFEVSPMVIACSADGVPQTGTLTVKGLHVKGAASLTVNSESYPADLPYKVQSRLNYINPENKRVVMGLWTDLNSTEYSLPANILRPDLSFRITDRNAPSGSILGNNQTVYAETSVPYVCDGGTGIQGAVTRIRGAFEQGTYYDGTEPDTAGMYWLDVVWVDNADKTARKYFRCTQSGTYTSANGPKYSNSDTNPIIGWEEMSYISALFTDLLLANNAYIKFLSGSRMVIYDEANNIWGRFGAPTVREPGVSGTNSELEGTILWTGGSSISNATFALNKSGKMILGNLSNPALGDNTHRQIVLDPVNKEIQVLTGGSMCVQIDGKTHDLDSAYAGSDYGSLVRSQWTGSSNTVNTNGTTRITLGTVKVGKAGGRVKGNVKVSVTAETLGVNTKPGTSINSVTHRGEASWSFGIFPKGSDVALKSVDAEKVTGPFLLNTEFDSQTGIGRGTTTSERWRGWDLPLPEGEYEIRMTVIISRPQSVTDWNGTTVGPLSSTQCVLSDYTCAFVAGNEPRCFIGANGLIVANSVQDYLKAGTVDGQWTIEGVSGGQGIRITGGKVYATDPSTGAFREIDLTKIFK